MLTVEAWDLRSPASCLASWLAVWLPDWLPGCLPDCLACSMAFGAQRSFAKQRPQSLMVPSEFTSVAPNRKGQRRFFIMATSPGSRPEGTFNKSASKVVMKIGSSPLYCKWPVCWFWGRAVMTDLPSNQNSWTFYESTLSSNRQSSKRTTRDSCKPTSRNTPATGI